MKPIIQKQIVHKPSASASAIRVIVPMVSALSGLIIGQTLLQMPSANAIYTKVAPSIVTVSSIGVARDVFSSQFVESRNGEGTGFAFGNSQFIVTNAHVINDALAVKVTDADNNTSEAIVLGKDILHDIALLQIPESSDIPLAPLPKCTFFPSIGEPVLAIGNPFGFERTLTSGIVSGIDRAIGGEQQTAGRPPLVTLIQTDAAINPGNSGGPLLDAKTGCVLGMNTAMISASGSSSGVGFAMPIAMVDKFVDSIVQGTPNERVQLGVTIVQDSIATFLGLDGAVIANVIQGGQADKLGLVGTQRDDSGRPIIGDIIIAINGKRIHNGVDLFAIMETLSKGDTITLTVLKNPGVEEYTIVMN